MHSALETSSKSRKGDEAVLKDYMKIFIDEIKNESEYKAKQEERKKKKVRLQLKGTKMQISIVSKI